jgi:hypothetical protein
VCAATLPKNIRMAARVLNFKHRGPNVLFLAKLTVTPVLMWFVSWVSRRWGSTIGGLLAGMPLTSAPVSIYLMLEQGRVFAADAALSSLAGVAAVTASYLVYAFWCGRVPIALCCILALSAFAGATGILLKLKLSYGPVLAIDILLISTGLVFCRAAGEKPATVQTPAWDLPARIAASTALVLAITLMARSIGPVFSGFLSPIPVIAWPLVVFVHRHQGRAEAIATIRGVLQGAFGLVLFCTVAGRMLPYYDPFWTYVIGLAGSILMVIPWLPPVSSLFRSKNSSVAHEASPVKNG